jgi:hypothetical protein
VDNKQLWRQCLGKARFSKIGRAVNRIHQIQYRTGKLMRAYHCEECHGYHLTSKVVNTGEVVEEQSSDTLSIFSSHLDKEDK